jgi:thiol-disulfide isomerase/thioredoxin
VQAAIDQGDRVVINVWASWCPKCTAQRRALSQVLGADPSLDDVKVFAIDIDDPLRPSSVGSHSISGNAARTTLVIFDQGQEVAVYGGRDAAAIAALFD